MGCLFETFNEDGTTGYMEGCDEGNVKGYNDEFEEEYRKSIEEYDGVDDDRFTWVQDIT